MVTIKQIADMCGVSRGTVDRVLNNRGNVRPEKRDMILEMAKKMNYTPDPAGRALVSKQNSPTLGIVLPAEGLRFFDEIIDAIKREAEKYALFGLNVIWRMTKGYDADAQADALEELSPKINALIVNPISAPKVREQINELVDHGIYVVTINNDIQQTRRHCYVGSDYRNGGETAAALLRMLHPAGGEVGVMLGSLQMFGHQERLDGFRSVIEKDGHFHVVAVAEDNDDDFCGYEAVSAMLSEHEEIQSMFFASSGGTYGACRAIASRQKESKLTIVAFDTVPGIVEMMKKGIIDATIYQHPRRQGQIAMQLAYDCLINGIRSEKTVHIIKNDIRIAQNL